MPSHTFHSAAETGPVCRVIIIGYVWEQCRESLTPRFPGKNVEGFREPDRHQRSSHSVPRRKTQDISGGFYWQQSCIEMRIKVRPTESREDITTQQKVFPHYVIMKICICSGFVRDVAQQIAHYIYCFIFSFNKNKKSLQIIFIRNSESFLIFVSSFVVMFQCLNKYIYIMYYCCHSIHFCYK